jgi:putative hydrolase
MDPVEALERIAELLQRDRSARPKAQAFRRAADAIRDLSRDQLETLAAAGKLTSLPGIGTSTATVITQALGGQVPEYLARVGSDREPDTEQADALRARLRGDLHLHSDWSDGGATIEEMAATAAEIGHQYLALTDHSPSLGVAHGLTTERLAEQLDVLAEVNQKMAPVRVLSGVEVDILADGSLDHSDDVLAGLDVVVASVHSKLAMDADAMTRRMVRAVTNPHVDVLGHCTGRLIVGRGRAESSFDAEAVFAACAETDTAVEINSRPERLDPPMRLLEMVVRSGCKVAIDSDAHATWQLKWQPYGCHRAAVAGVNPDRVVNTWDVDRLLDWTAGHASASR